MENVMEKYNFTFHFYSNRFLTERLKGNEDFTKIDESFDGVIVDGKFPLIKTRQMEGRIWFADGDEENFDSRILEHLIRLNKLRTWEKLRIMVIGDINTYVKLAPYFNTVTVLGGLSQAEIDKYTDFIAKHTRENDEQLHEPSSTRVRVRQNNQLSTVFNMMIPEPWIIDHVYAMDWTFSFIPDTTTTICSGSLLLNPRYGNYTIGSVMETSKPSTAYSRELGKKYALEKLLTRTLENAGSIFSYTEHTQLKIPPLYDMRPHHLRVKK